MFVSDVELCSGEDLLPWAATVLRRMHLDFLRREERRRVLPAAERQARPGVDAEVMARLDLAAVAEVVARWTPEARATLFRDDDAGTRQTNAFYVRRHRLRARLLAVIEGMGAFGPISAVRTRIRRLDAAVVDHASNAATFLLPPAAAACLSLVLGVGAPPTPAPAGSSLAAGTASHATQPRFVVAANAAHVVAGSSGAAAGGPSAPDAGSTRNTTGRGPGPIVRSPVETRAEFDAGPYRPSVEVDDNEEREPLWCMESDVVPGRRCVDHPLYQGPAAGLVPQP